MILLDLNLPRKDRREVLTEIKQDPDLKRIPVVILTSSEQEQDTLRTCNLHANGYISERVDLEKVQAVVNGIAEFCLRIVKLPPM